MENYIKPKIKKYTDIDELLKNDNNHSFFLFDEYKDLSIDDLIQEHFVCIVGEPGIGKSRLIEEIKHHNSKKTLYSCSATEFKLQSIPNNIEYCLIDALDEVDGASFYSTLQSIKQYKENNPQKGVLFTCRKHYVASSEAHFSVCKDLIYVELCKLSDNDVRKVVSEKTISYIDKNPKIKELLTIPRYLTFLLEYEKQKGGISNIKDLFEHIISSSIQNAIKKRSCTTHEGNITILIERALEKVAFIMEISRKDQISKDELYSILDGAKGNMTQMLITNFDLFFFESRILKEQNETLRFENTELQEYLACKELCRQDNVESILYDVAVQKDLKHIYPNWYDVIPHISYTTVRIHTFLNIIKLIVSYESNLDTESFNSLLRYVDPSIFSDQQKKELFSVIIEHYMRKPSYIGWISQIPLLMQKCYTSSCDESLIIDNSKELNKIQLANIRTILKAIVEGNELSFQVSNHWTTKANELMKGNTDNQLVALDLYNALNNREILISFSQKFHEFSPEVKNKYFEVTGDRGLTDKSIVDCWVKGISEKSNAAKDAVLLIKDPSTIIYAYEKIINENKLDDFFTIDMSNWYHDTYHINEQFKIVWQNDSNSKTIITKVIAGFVKNDHYSTHKEINTIIKQILNEEQYKNVFFQYGKFDENDKEFFGDLYPESERYKDTKKAIIKENDNPILTNAYKGLFNQDAPKEEKYGNAFKLVQHIDFLKEKDTSTLKNVIVDFFSNINLDELTIKKRNLSFSIPNKFNMIPYFVKAMSQLDCIELLKSKRIRDILGKTLPIVLSTSYIENNLIKKIYKSIIGEIGEQEKKELTEWWKSRNDDFMDISSSSVFTCITDYRLDALSYKLEMYIEEYLQKKAFSQHDASKALELISQGYLNWDIKKFRELFDKLDDDNIGSLKMQCNAIMIEIYHDTYAINWRFEYLKEHIVRTCPNYTGHVQNISCEEAELISPSPRMFRCFMNIRGNDPLNEKMFELFIFGLSLCKENETQEYAHYLLSQIYQFYINTDNGIYITKLRKEAETFNAQNVSCNVYNTMNYYEMMYLEKDNTTITKAIRLYNRCIETSYKEIRNNSDLRRYFSLIQAKVKEEIEDQGIYSLVRKEGLNEDFIQRELKNTIINICCQMGLETIHIDREVALQDNKRTDLLIRYGLCDPIMVEIKLLHNKEIQNEELRLKYKDKFLQYTKANNACLSVFWVFDVHKKEGIMDNFNNLKNEYKDCNNTLVLFTDCKCSSLDTGIKNSSKKGTTINTQKKHGQTQINYRKVT